MVGGKWSMASSCSLQVIKVVKQHLFRNNDEIYPRVIKVNKCKNRFLKTSEHISDVVILGSANDDLHEHHTKMIRTVMTFAIIPREALKKIGKS